MPVYVPPIGVPPVRLKVAAFRQTEIFGGQLTTGHGVRENESTASPSSARIALKSLQRIQKVFPFPMDKPIMVELTTVKLGKTLPFNGPTGA